MANEVFSPTAAEIERARAVLAAYEQAGQGAIAHGGSMVDRPVAEEARQLLAHAAALGMMGEES